MDESATAALRTRPLTDPAKANGLADEVRAVQQARERLGRDLDVLNEEIRAQMGFTVEKLAWKAASIGAAVVSGIAVRKILVGGWHAIQGGDPPANPAAPGTHWGEAVAWTLASGVGVAVAKLVAMRGAAAGWEAATGHLPPGLEEVSA